MTLLKTERAASVDAMSANLWLEKACSVLIPALPLWIIEFAWTQRMLEVLEALGPPLWLEGDLQLLSLDEPCKIRAVAAEAWRIVKTRNIKHFERVIEFLDVICTLEPSLVTPIKLMKIRFGLQTLFIMWMLWSDESMDKISHKLESFFPNNFPNYQRCRRKHVELMQKNQTDFKSFAHLLATDREMRETYIQESMEEQYGERYAQKLEERLSHYLEQLDKVLLQPSYVEQVLQQPLLYERGEKILKTLLSRDSVTPGAVLKRLLHFASSNPNLDGSITSSFPNSCEERYKPAVVKPSLGILNLNVWLSQTSRTGNPLSQSNTEDLFGSQGLLQKENPETVLSQEEICDGEVTSTQLSESETDEAISQSLLKDMAVRNKQGKLQSDPEVDFTETRCSRHGKKTRSILQECSEELHVDDVEAECTPSSTQSTPPFLPSTSQPQKSPNQHSQPDSSTTNSSTGSDLSNTPFPSLLQQPSSNPKLSTFKAGPLLNNKTQLKLSLESQSFLMQSKFLQPQVCLSNLSRDECAKLVGSNRECQTLSTEQELEDNVQYAFFDVNTLYSDSYSDETDLDSDDSDYKLFKD